MKHAVIVGHPDAASLNLSLAKAYGAAASRRGHKVILRDLYRMGFNPCLGAEELPGPGFKPGADVAAERALLEGVDVFTFVYPLWFNAPPAIVKGYMDRVFGFGFGYGPIRGGGNTPLLDGQKMLSLTTSGAPEDWLKGQADWGAIRTLDGHFASVCGLELLDHLHFGGIVPNMTREAAGAELDRVEEAFARLF
jgi:NAD(P)H dehydrogenase (quinone)